MAVDLHNTRIFADGANRDGILELRSNPLIQGFTTNPTLMRAAGVEDYESFAIDLVGLIPDRPISFEVFSDDADGMLRQALKIATWGSQVHVKIPITDTNGTSTAAVQRALAAEGVQLNATALLTLEQVEEVADALAGGPHSFVSVFAGRVADTGRDPVPHMKRALEILAPARQPRTAVGEPPRDPQRRAGGRDGLPRDHGDARPAEEARLDRARPR